MANVTITIEDTPDGKINVCGEFGNQFDESSKAHSISQVLIQSVLQMAKNYQVISDTMPDVDMEPKMIVLPS